MRRIGMLLLAAALCAVLIALPAADAVEVTDWAEHDVYEAFRHGVISERVLSCDYREEITRQQFCNQVMQLYRRLAGVQYIPGASDAFIDTYDSDVGAAYAMGIVNGVGEGRFAPYAAVTRQEIAKMMTCLLIAAEIDCAVSPEEEAALLADYADGADIDAWARPYVAAMTKSGYMHGTDAGFDPRGHASIEQAIILSMRIYRENTEATDPPAPVIVGLDRGQILPYGEVTLAWEAAGEGGTEYALLSGTGGYISWQWTAESSVTLEEDTLYPGVPYDLVVRQGDHLSAPVRFYYGKRDLEPVLWAGERAYRGSGWGEWFYAEDYLDNPQLLYAPVRFTWESMDGVAYYEVSFTQARTGYEGRAPDLPMLTANVGTEPSFTVPMLKPVRYYEFTVCAYDETGAELSNGTYICGTGSPVSYEMKREKLGDETQEQAVAGLRTVSFPVWRLDKNGNKYASTASVTVRAQLADDVVAIFTEIFNGPEQFPFNTIGGYRVGGGEHGWGTAIDLNYDQNYCIYTSGEVVGSYYKPFEDPYSIPPDGDVITAFERYGWVWGGDAWSGNIDYMHFSYNGR